MVEVFTVGVCNKAGVGGWAAVVTVDGARHEASGADTLTNPDRTELMAAIGGLKSLRRRCAVELYARSQYLVQGAVQLIPIWKTLDKRRRELVRNQYLWDQLYTVASRHDIQWHVGEGGSGNAAYRLAELAMTGRVTEGGNTGPATITTRSHGSAAPVCKKCNAEITWRKEGGKWMPVDLDGASHFQSCKRTIEKLASGFHGIWGRTSGDGSDVACVYNGLALPWADSLGEYRSFTDEEINTQEGCYKIDDGEPVSMTSDDDCDDYESAALCA
jgi:ribonuclease HI